MTDVEMLKKFRALPKDVQKRFIQGNLTDEDIKDGYDADQMYRWVSSEVRMSATTLQAAMAKYPGYGVQFYENPGSGWLAKIVDLNQDKEVIGSTLWDYAPSLAGAILQMSWSFESMMTNYMRQFSSADERRVVINEASRQYGRSRR